MPAPLTPGGGGALDGVGSVSRVPSGDLFGLYHSQWLAYAPGADCGQSHYNPEDPMGVFGMTRNTFTGTISNGSGGLRIGRAP